MIREALVSYVQLAFPEATISEAHDFPSAWQAATSAPEIILCDLDMPGAKPGEGIARLREAAPEAKVLVVTGVEDDALLVSLFDLGIGGFLPKKSSGRIIEAAIRLLLAGGHYIPDRVIEMAARRDGGVTGAFADTKNSARLTNRQISVLQQMAKGMSDKEIARQLGISPATVKAHAMAAYAELGAANRAEAVARALALGAIVSKQAV
jgi:two-component system, NarL family, nitrate/nitrite response regulator NarL